MQLARAVNELTFAVDRLVGKQHREAGDHASQDEYSHILDSLAKAKLQIQKTIDAILDDG